MSNSRVLDASGASTTENPEQKDIKLYNKTFWFGIGLSVVLTFAFWATCHYATWECKTSDLIAVFSSLIIVATLYFSSKVFVQSHNKHRENLAFEKLKLEYEKAQREEEIRIRKTKFSFQITEEWHKPGMAEKVNSSKLYLDKFLKKVKKQKCEKKDLGKELKKNPEERLALLTILNYFEHVSILMKEDFADEKTIKKAFRFLFTKYFSITEEFIKQVQTDHSDQSILKHYVEYAQKWARQD